MILPTLTALRHKKIIFSAVIAGALVASLIGVSYNAARNVQAADSEVYSQKPAYDEVPATIVGSVEVTRNLSLKDAVALEVSAEDNTITVGIANTGSSTTNLDVSTWIISLSSELFKSRIEYEEIDASSMIGEIDAGQTAVLKTFDLEQYSDIFETYPGLYTVDVRGMQWDDELSGNKEVFWLTAKVSIDYDTRGILANPNKLLKADGLQMSVRGDGEMFEIIDNNPKIVTFYLQNDEQAEISGIVKGHDLLMWNSEDRSKPDGETAINEIAPDADCFVLEPGERMAVTSYEFSKSSWPLAGTGISQLYDSDTAVPGLYIANFQVDTVPCSLQNGEEVAGGIYSLIAAFEVKP